MLAVFFFFPLEGRTAETQTASSAKKEAVTSKKKRKSEELPAGVRGGGRSPCQRGVSHAGGVNGVKAKGEVDEGGEVMAESSDDVIRHAALMNERQEGVMDGCRPGSH